MLALSVQGQIIDESTIATMPTGNLNALSWNRDLLRIITLQTISTHQHPSSKVQAEKDAVGLAVNTRLLRSAATRMRDLAQQKQTTEEGKLLTQTADKNEKLARTIEKDTKDKVNTWNADLTWIVAKKAMLVSVEEDWMGVRRAESKQ